MHAYSGPSRWFHPGRGEHHPIFASGSPRPLALSHVYIVLIPQVRWQRSEAAPTPWFIFQPLHSFLHKPLYPLVGMATAQANRRGNVGDRHPVSQE